MLAHLVYKQSSVLEVIKQSGYVLLHKLRTLMVFPNRDMLSGKVEVDETFVGGVAEGKRGRGAEN